MKHYFIRIFRIALLQESRNIEIKLADNKKIEMSVETSVNSYAIIFGYSVNAFKPMASLHSQLP